MSEIINDQQPKSPEVSVKSKLDFFLWYRKKVQINQKEVVPPFNQRDVWWCSLGLNVGYEADGKNDQLERPVLVLRKFGPDSFIGLPITSTVKDSMFYFPYFVHGVKGSVMLSQPRLLSAKRLNRKMSRVGRGLFKKIGDKYLSLYSPDGGNPA
jgi:mRNA interferase MazF